MRRRDTVRLAFAALVGLTIMVADVASARASITAMACCAKTKGDCAGVKTPDDCCRGMGHVDAGPTSNTPQRQPTLNAPSLHAVLSPISDATGSTPVISVAFKRPHDPPYLHTFDLLI